MKNAKTGIVMVDIGNVAQIPKLCLIYPTLSYNLYIVRYMQQIPFFRNIHHTSSCTDTVNTGNFWSSISQFPKLFLIYHLLGFIRDTLHHKLYIVGYMQQVPFFHNNHHPPQRLWYIFCRSSSIFKRITELSDQLFHLGMCGAQF